MENKYYTPSIEEFYIGFEYQILDEDEDDLGYQWREVGAEEIWELEDAADILEHKDNIRVKYLDQYDIEELGFNLSYQMKDLIAFTINVDYSKIIDKNELNVKEASYGICLNYSTHSNYLVIRGWLDPDDVFFKGNIKNKSELKKLLKQLNII